jgi:hypothetical protein
VRGHTYAHRGHAWLLAEKASSGEPIMPREGGSAVDEGGAGDREESLGLRMCTPHRRRGSVSP